MINFATKSEADAQLAAREAGLPAPALPDIDPNDRSQLPAGGSTWPLPPHLSVVGLVNQSVRSFFWTHDAALKKNRADAVACREDAVIHQAIMEAKTPIAQLDWVIEPTDETNPAEVDAASRISLAIAKTPRLTGMFMQLLEALWFGRAGVQLVWTWDSYDPTLMHIRDWSSLQGDSLVARWASGAWGILVNSAYEGETEPCNLGRAHFFTREEENAVVIHQSECEAPDWYDTVGAGSIRGIGWRARVFWTWYIKANLFGSALDLAERIGWGIWLAGFDQSNPNGRADWERAIAEYRQKRVLSVPQDRDGKTPYTLNILEPGSTSHAIFENLIRYCDGCNRAVILGHPLGAGAEVAVGGDPSAIFGDAISRATKYHAQGLAETLTAKLLPIYYRFMFPHVQVGRFRFLTDHPDADALLSYAERLGSMGWPTDLDSLGEICGLVKAASGSQIYSKVQGLNPVAVDSGPPQNVPIAGTTPAVPQSSVAPQQSTSVSPAIAQAGTSVPSGVPVQ